MSDDVLYGSLQTLSELLYKHFNQKTVILIDEYDVPLDKAFQHGYYREMVALIRAMFGRALKTNEALAFAVLTGCLRVSKESIVLAMLTCIVRGMSLIISIESRTIRMQDRKHTGSIPAEMTL